MSRIFPHFVAVAVVLAASPALAYLNNELPFAAIEYQPGQADTLDGTVESFDSTDPVHFRETKSFDSAYVLDAQGSDNITIDGPIRGYAHLGDKGVSQSTANGRIDLIQIWKWTDRDGDLFADIDDEKRAPSTTTWQKVWEVDPNSDDGGVTDADVQGWEISETDPPPVPPTETWNNLNLMNGNQSFTLSAGAAHLLLIRVIDTSGNTNLMGEVGGTEQWDDGDTTNMIGSNVDGDDHIDFDAIKNGDIEDDDIVTVIVKP